MVRQKTKQMSQHKKKMQLLFDTLDTSNDGSISKDEFMVIAEHPEVGTWLASMGLETDDLENVFYMLDIDQSHTITMEELIVGVNKLQGPARSIDLLTLMERNRMEM